MSIPDYPENRREEYLNNIATGSGEIPPYPENREEQYLDAIARNGGGGGGSGGGVLVVHADWEDDVGTLDKTWQEINTALSNDQIVLIKDVGEGLVAFDYVTRADDYEGIYEVFSMSVGEFPFGCVATKWATNTANGYPVWTDPDA